MLFLIVTMMISAPCVVFDCYDDYKRALCIFLIVTMMLSALCVVFFVATMMFSALCVAFDCNGDD